MAKERPGGISPDMLASLRANPALASVSDEALAKIAELVSSETAQKVTAALKDVEFFKGLSTDDLSEVQRISEAVVLEAGEVLFEEGDPGDHFYVIVSGVVELFKGTGRKEKRLAVLKGGQAFGEMALLNDAPRSASARVSEAAYLIGISRQAFEDLLGGDTLAVRLLKGLSTALWATSVRLTARDREGESARAAIAEFNRMARGRLLPRGAPRVDGFDASGSTLVHDKGDGAAAWDWFTLRDGRTVLAVFRADRANLSAAQHLATARLLLRQLASAPPMTLGEMLTDANRGLRTGWVEGLSGPVTCGLVALGAGEIELAGAGSVTGVLVRRSGGADDLVSGAPALGEESDPSFESMRIIMDEGDHVIMFSDGPGDSVEIARGVLAAGEFSGAREGLATVIGRIKSADAGIDGVFDVTATLVTRRGPDSDSVKSAADEITKAAGRAEGSAARPVADEGERGAGGPAAH